MPARSRHVQMRIGASGLAIEPRQAIMRIGTGLFAIVTAHAELFIDQEHIGGFADTIVDEEVGDPRVHVDDTAETVLLRFDEGVVLDAAGHIIAHPRHQFGLVGEQAAEAFALELDHIGLDRGPHRCRAGIAVDHSHFTDIGTGRHIREKHRLAADGFFHDHRARTDDVDIVAGLAFLDDRLAGPDRLDPCRGDDIGQVIGAKPRFEDLQQAAQRRDACDFARRRRHRRHQLEGGAARNFHQHAIAAGADGGTAATARNQTHFAKNFALADWHRDRRIIRVDLDQHLAIGNTEQR